MDVDDVARTGQRAPLSPQAEKMPAMATAYQTWPMNLNLQMPNGARVVDTIGDLSNGLLASSDYGDIVTEAAAGKWDAVRTRFAQFQWTPDDLATQMAYWGAEVQRLSMMPAFTLGGKVWYSRQLQVWLASSGLMPAARLGEGSYGVAHLICPAVSTGACDMVIKVQEIRGGNSAEAINREYEIMRYINRAEPGLAPMLRSDLTLITDAVNSADPADTAQFLFFAMDQWSGNIYSRLAQGPSDQLAVHKTVLDAFINSVTRLFQTDISGILDVRRKSDDARVRYITNLDGLTTRNVLYIADAAGRIGRLGIGDWGFISDLEDPNEYLTEWLDYRKVSKLDRKTLNTNPMSQEAIVRFFWYCVKAIGGTGSWFEKPVVALVDGPLRTRDSVLYRPPQVDDALPTKTAAAAPASSSSSSLFSRLTGWQ